ncbi:tetratricopeptide repeat protein [Winogradskyella forsetii]|uniref:tetratricopeptide repeat protein n=1 Tax=Winogradskyella forsetii TaxID=2686077 RepID=UPI0015B7D408|nr:tetratricopeptide repeat protein [Winogradskyella forsetii]
MGFKQTYLFLLFNLSICVWNLAANNWQNKDVDSLLDVKSATIYENPNAFIEYGLSVFNDDTNSIITKINALMHVSTAYSSKRDYKKALEYSIIANELSEQVIDNPMLKINILLRTGILYQQLKIFDKSMEVLDKAEQLSIAHPNRKEVAFALGNIYLTKGFIYKDNLNCDIGLVFFDKGISEYEQIEEFLYLGNLSIAYYNKGNCYTVLSEYGMAKNSFYKAIELAKIHKANSLISFAQKGLAEVYTLEGKYQESIDLLTDALEKSSEVGDIVLNHGIYKGLFENYLALNQWDKYQTNYDLFLTTQLAIKESERNSVSNSIVDSSKSKSEELQAIKSNFNLNLKIVIFLNVFFIVVIGYFEFRNRKIIKSLHNTVKTIQNTKQVSDH